jgi:ubiquinone biosynthesis protein Coq4
MFKKTWLKAKVAYSFARVVRNPDRLDEVFAIADTLSEVEPEVIEQMRHEFAKDPDGRKALSTRPRIGKIELADLEKLPPGTLGRAFAEHMRKNGLDPAAMPIVESKDEIEFIRAHLYETHDIWHVLTGFDADVAGELGLQAFYMTQLSGKLPTVLLALGFLNAALYAHEDRDRRMSAIVRGWTIGRRAKKLFGADWSSLWPVPLAEVRRRFAIDVACVDAELRTAA